MTDSIDKGLAEAFGQRDDEITIPASSVLRTLQSRTQSQLGVHLDSPSALDAPVKVTDEARQLRDPSGRYQVLGEIGRGGVGTVYKGRDHDLGRDVAMKVLKDEYAQRTDVLARFVEEAQIGGQLQHPGIVPVYELGLEAGERPYFAMKLVKGETLAVHLARRDAHTEDRRRLLGVFEQVCQTMAYAHARRVVHRDLKPANVMIGAFGEVQVVDWGFAKVLPKGGVADEKESVQAATERSVIETVRSQEGSGSGSVAGSMLGTPAYMPPEQALGDIDRVDQRSDVFALGAILCEILTGQPPYRGRQLVRQAANATLDGAHERLSNCGADQALIALCNECMSPARRARPESAQELAERIGDYLHSVEERARKAELRAAEVRFRHRVTVVAAAAALLLVALGAGSWIYLQNEEQKQRAADTQLVADAMSQTNRALGNAMAATDTIDVTQWDAADQSAASLRSLLQSGDIESDVRGQARELLDQVDEESTSARATAAQQAHDAAMVARLQDLLIPTEDDVREEGFIQRDLRRLDKGYTQAFAEHVGEPLFEMPIDRAVEALQGDIAVELAVAIDRWGLIRDSLANLGDEIDSDVTKHIRDVATRLDTTRPWRVQLRALLPRVTDEGEALVRLAAEAEQAALGPAEYRLLSQALFRAGQIDVGIANLERGQRAHPDDFGLGFYLAVNYEVWGQPRWKDAQHAYRILNALDPEHEEVLHRRGLALDKLRRYADSERVFRMLVDRAPESVHWLRHLAGSLRRLNRRAEAIALLERAILAAPRDSQNHKVLGLIFQELGRFPEAIEAYEKAIKLNYRNAEAHSNLGNTLSRVGQPEKALEHHDIAVKLFPDIAIFRNNYGRTLLAQGHRDQALEHLRKACELANRGGEIGILMSAAWGLFHAGFQEEAMEHFHAAIDLDPERSFSYNDLGSAHAERGEGQLALKAYGRSLELDPDNANTQFNYAYSLAQTDQHNKAVEHYRLAIGLAPTDWQALTYLAESLVKLDEIDEAIAELQKATRINPRSVRAHNMLGAQFAKQNNLPKARASYEAAFANNPSNPATRLNLGGMYDSSGERDRAIAEYEAAERLLEARSGSSRNPDFEQKLLIQVRKRLADIELWDEILAQKRVASSSAEWAAAASAGWRWQSYANVVRLAEHTEKHAPTLIDPTQYGLYNAACSAVLLTADAMAPLDDAERTRIRGLARNWLTRANGHWKKALGDTDFASVRGEALKSLSEGEREAWQQLWAKIRQSIE